MEWSLPCGLGSRDKWKVFLSLLLWTLLTNSQIKSIPAYCQWQLLKKESIKKVTLLVRPQLNLSFCRQIFRLLFESRNCSLRSEHYVWHSWRISGWNDNLEKVFDVLKESKGSKGIKTILKVSWKCSGSVIRKWFKLGCGCCLLQTNFLLPNKSL